MRKLVWVSGLLEGVNVASLGLVAAVTEHVLFDLVGHNFTSWAAVVSLRTGERRILVEDAAYPRYLPTGHLVFTHPGTLLAVPFSLKRLEASGPPFPLLEDLRTNYGRLKSAEFAISQEGIARLRTDAATSEDAGLGRSERRGGADSFPTRGLPGSGPFT